MYLVFTLFVMKLIFLLDYKVNVRQEKDPNFFNKAVNSQYEKWLGPKGYFNYLEEIYWEAYFRKKKNFILT